MNYHRPFSSHAPKPPVPAETLASGVVKIERKTFAFSLKENPRGRFLRITEEGKGQRESIVIPATGLADFKRLLDEMSAAGQVPPNNP